MLMYADFSAYREIIVKGMAFMRAPHAAAKIALLEPQPLFSAEMFEALICGGESYRTGPINFIWERLLSHRIVIPSFGNRASFVDHVIDTPILLEHLRGDTFSNLFAPPRSARA